MRIAFINPPVWHYTGVAPLNFNSNLGVLMLAAVLENKGHDVRVFDAEALRWSHDMVLVALRDYSPTSVGITGTTLGWPSIKRLVDKIKMATAGQCRVVLGGPHVSHDPQKSVEESGADCVVKGEAEDIVEEVMLGGSVPAVVIPPERVNFSVQPWPARHLNVPAIDTNLYTGNAPRYSMPETCVNWQRGCPHSCSYCSHTVYGNQPIRHRDPDDIVAELSHLKRWHHIKTVFVYDDELIGVSEKQNEWLHTVLDKIISAGLGLTLKTQGRCSKGLVSPRLANKMKRAGFRCVMLGCESGSEEVLEAMNKRTTPEDIEHTVRTIHDAGIDTFCFWMVGNLEETPAHVSATEALIRKLIPWTTWKQVTICTPWVGSRVHDRAKAEGWFLSDDPTQWLADRPAMQTPWMTERQMVECRDRLVAI